MKKVLIITYYWPPAGGPGVQRVLKFVKYLPQFGWEPIVLTVKNGEFPAIDQSLEKDIPVNCTVYKAKSLEPFALYKKFIGKNDDNEIPTFVLNKNKSDSFKDKLAKWIRLNFFIPDAKIGWIPFAVSDGIKIINKHNIDLIFSSSPPHSVNIVGKKISQKSGLFWVADYRDPWTDAFWHEGGSNRNYFSHKIDSILEKSCLARANTISTVSESLIKLFERKAKNDYMLLPNGFDSDDFNNIINSSSQKFRIHYIGYLGKDQKINNFLEAIISLPKELIQKIEINFYGNIHQTIIDKIDSLALKNVIKINPYVSHKDAVNIMKNSELLLLVIPDVRKNALIVTGKLFEYLATENYILGIGPTDSDVIKILNKTKCGEMFNYSDDLNKVLTRQIQKWENGQQISVNSEALQNYSRKALASQLAEKFNQVINH